MDLAISNLAWNSIEELPNQPLYIECVFAKIGNVTELNTDTLDQWAKKYLAKNYTPYSVQSINFNSPIEVFAYDELNKNYYSKIIELSKFLNLKRIVFGSPGIRKGKLNSDILKYIDDLLQPSDIYWCIEPNSKFYKGEYFFNIAEIVDFLDSEKFSNIKTMLDTHNSFLEDKNPNEEYVRYKKYIEHIHISEINLGPLSNFTFHSDFANTLKEKEYSKVVTYESKTMDGVDKFLKIYR
jgi:sugar phosphate isomerase/epimerase